MLENKIVDEIDFQNEWRSRRQKQNLRENERVFSSKAIG